MPPTMNWKGGSREIGRVMSIEEAAAGLSGARIAFGGRRHSRKSLGFVEALIESEAEALDWK